ncbi:MAG: ribulokinase [Lachnospiraceae bacterium]|nr:ribulokinase [Lachnospiraceae bacterium]
MKKKAVREENREGFVFSDEAWRSAEDIRPEKSGGYTLGIDCGTQSARAVIVRVKDGSMVSDFDMAYPHGILSETLPCGLSLPRGFVLAMAEDYLEVIPVIVQGALKKAGISGEDLVGIGVDATSCTVIPCTEDGTPMAMLPEHGQNPHAYVKLWKHHDVKRQAREIEALAQRRGERFLAYYGGVVSCEWMLPKVLQIYEDDREIFDRTAHYVDLCDWLTWRFTGKLTRSVNSAGFKGLWSAEEGDISREFLNELHDGFGEAYYAKVLKGPVLLSGARCGRLCQEAARWLGLPFGIVVSSGMMDGHASVVSMGMKRAGEMALIVGTSNAIPILADHLKDIEGFCGVVRDGIIPGFYGYTAGQIATGDMLDWYINNMVTARYTQEAGRLGVSLHKYLSEKAKESFPERNPLTILDWWNGNRSILCNQQLTGTIWGLTLSTKPEEIYCAMLQGIACGTRIIMDQGRACGIDIKKVFACGGIPRKDPFFMQQYANILNMPVYAANETNSSAHGSAICAAAAAGRAEGGYASLAQAMEHMHIRDLTEYRPQQEYAAAYEKIYERYCRLHWLLGSRNREFPDAAGKGG